MWINLPSLRGDVANESLHDAQRHSTQPPTGPLIDYLLLHHR